MSKLTMDKKAFSKLFTDWKARMAGPDPVILERVNFGYEDLASDDFIPDDCMEVKFTEGFRARFNKDSFEERFGIQIDDIKSPVTPSINQSLLTLANQVYDVLQSMENQTQAVRRNQPLRTGQNTDFEIGALQPA